MPCRRTGWGGGSQAALIRGSPVAAAGVDARLAACVAPSPALFFISKGLHLILYNPARFPFCVCPMQYLKDLITAAAIVAVAWLVAVAILSL